MPNDMPNDTPDDTLKTNPSAVRTLRGLSPLLVGLLVLPFVGGCQSAGPSAGELLAGAHRSLEQDDVDLARQWLGSAQTVASSADERRDLELLLAEVEVRTGGGEDALPAVTQLLQQHPNDPRVHEVAGKVRLVRGEFEQATRHFQTAQTRYDDEIDVGRAGDLTVLSRGFESYARGNIGDATDAWSTIRDDALRASVLGAPEVNEAPAADQVAFSSLSAS